MIIIISGIYCALFSFVMFRQNEFETRDNCTYPQLVLIALFWHDRLKAISRNYFSFTRVGAVFEEQAWSISLQAGCNSVYHVLASAAVYLTF